MKKARQAICLLLSLAFLPMMCGCWDYMDVEDVAVGMGIAIDKTDNGDYMMTVEIATPSSGGSEGGGSLKSIRVTVEGKTLFDCMRNMAKKLEQKVYYPHAQVVIISEQVAKEGTEKILDMLARSLELRLTLFLMVSKEQTAKEIFETKSLMSQIHSLSIASMLENNKLNLSKAPSPYLYEAIDDACQKGICMVLPAIEIVTDGGSTTAELAGTAVFHEEKLMGYLNDEESRALLFVLNKIKGGLLIVQVDTPTSKRPNISLEIIKSSTMVKPVIQDNVLSMKIDIELEVRMGENQSGMDFSNEYSEDKLIRITQETLKRDIGNVIKKAQQELSSDIFGFGSTVRKEMPQVWAKIEPFWFERYYKTLPVAVSSKIEIRNKGLLRRPLDAGN